VVLCAVWCPILAGTRATFGDEALEHGTEEMGRIFDGTIRNRIRDNRARRVEVRRKIVDGWVNLWSGFSGLFGIPARIIQGITIAVGGLCGLCCAGLGLLAFMACLWAGVRVYQGRAA
jgi:hypothetical protein